MNKQIILGTKNKDKRREIERLLKGSGIKVLALQDFLRCADAVEDGKTFEANARKKARVYSRHTRALVLADDSGLSVFALNGRPGVYSARFAGPGRTYHDNNKKLLRLLKDRPKAGRSAKFICSMALYASGRPVAVVKKECRGRIAEVEKGKNGFGYDPVFIPEGYFKTFAELSPKVKNKISHRSKALRAIRISILDYWRRSRSHPEISLVKRDALWRTETKPDEEAISSAIWTTNTAKSQAARKRRSAREVSG